MYFIERRWRKTVDSTWKLSICLCKLSIIEEDDIGEALYHLQLHVQH